jgi:hypothetical protein
MKSNIVNTTNDEIEVLDMPKDLFARVRIREQGTTWRAKASIFLGSDQLEAFAQECLDMARRIRGRYRGLLG